METDKTQGLGKRKRRKRGSLGQLRGVLWASLLELEALAGSSEPETQIKACNALAALSRAFVTCLQVGDLEKRLSEVETRLSQSNTTNGKANVRIIQGTAQRN
jgi:hypothetical protein